MAKGAIMAHKGKMKSGKKDIMGKKRGGFDKTVVHGGPSKKGRKRASK